MSEAVPVAFRSINQKPGLQIWTIEKMKMVPVPAQAYGNFFEGDCYIVLCGRQSSSQLSFDVHYWIGSQSSQDEQGAAAILVTQLDNFLGGSPIQYREVQDCESVKFKSYFKNGIVYKKGGLASGFKQVETNMYNIKRLLHVKGRKNFSATEVDVSWNSFNVGDIFLLDMGKVIVQWNGPESNHPERLKGMMLSQDIRDRERGGRAQIGVVDGDNEAANPELMKIMTAVLGQRTGSLKPATPDNRPDLYQKSNVRLYHVSDSSGNLVVQEIATQPLTQDLLNSDDCYIVDQGGVKIFVWKGKNATTQERQAGLGRAEGFIKAKNYPSTTNVEIMNEDAESSMFKQLFKTWTEKGLTQGLGKTHAVGKIAKVDQVKFDVMELHARPDLAARERMVDDGSGKVEVWRIEELELKEVDPSTYGQFYGGDCYLVLYTYSRGQKPHYILYMWQGLQASQDEITASAYQAVNLDNKYNGEPVQVRVTMTKEPRHFLAIFKGKLIIYQGGTGRGGKAAQDPAYRLFQVRGTDEYNTKASEVPARASSLNTNDVFVLRADHVCYLWCGKGCSGDERERAKSVADIVSKQDKQTVLEGQEPADFWVALGGKAPYCSDKRFQEEKPQRVPRLFECSNQTGRFMMTEVFDFAQEDLDEEDVMLLDTWEEIFLWIGKAANDVEKKESLTSAAEYLKTHPAQRDPGTPVTTVTQGHEPLTFTGWFSAWDPHKWNDSRSYEDIKNSLGDASAISQITVDLNKTDLNKGKGGASKSPASGYSAPGGPSTPLDTVTKNKPRSVRTDKTDGRSPAAPNGRTTGYDPELLINKTAEELPEGVDSSRKEDFLSDADFEDLLGTTRSEFSTMPAWRQKHLKKTSGLF
ncbi:villin-1 [Acipenser oxyrinchus oxyrinchus]|uniref:Villin-1 n=1 Tax=Acipenser oxyrinchus oxyrinchus TaxID=40147 RepID=A0AAD8GD13_ACIOX|nr:villin-1 [Acipenser oxyrinchus oxyrinchus]